MVASSVVVRGSHGQIVYLNALSKADLQTLSNLIDADDDAAQSNRVANGAPPPPVPNGGAVAPRPMPDLLP